ncbi:hypothetical protein VPH35_100915 [Triticum aestivum]
MINPWAEIKRTELPEDVVLEILTHVADAATLLRCATTCKRWHALVAEPSFVRRRHQMRMAAVGVYGAEWALSKVMRWPDVAPGQNGLLLTRGMVQDGPIPRLFRELEQVGHNGMPNVLAVPVLIDVEAGDEKVAALQYDNAIMAYRIFGPGLREFLRDSRISVGDRIDVYACRRGVGERCLLFFNNKGAQG